MNEFHSNIVFNQINYIVVSNEYVEKEKLKQCGVAEKDGRIYQLYRMTKIVENPQTTRFDPTCEVAVKYAAVEISAEEYSMSRKEGDLPLKIEEISKIFLSTSVKSVEESASNPSKVTCLSPHVVSPESEKIVSLAVKGGDIPNLAPNGNVWRSINKEISDHGTMISTLIAQENLVFEILSRQMEIRDQRENFRSLIDKDVATAQIRQEVLQFVEDGVLVAFEQGQGGAYILSVEGKPKFVVKPNDQDKFCLHNRKGYGTPLISESIRVRSTIPTYQSVQNEVLGSEIAGLVGMRDLVPETIMVIIKHSAFHLISDELPPKFANELISGDEREKLCSAQRYAQNAESFIDFTNREEKNNEKFTIDQIDFENANIFTWIVGDQDAHLGNYLVYEKEDDLIGIKKIDNGLICGDGPALIRNGLVGFSQIHKKISDNGKKLINNIPIEQIIEKMLSCGKSDRAVEELKKRIEDMRQAIKENPEMTLKEMNNRFLLTFTSSVSESDSEEEGLS